MKKALFILTLFMLLKPFIPIVEYAVNYEYISKVLCVNKAKPELKCNGKCHLMKELAKSSESEKPISDKKIAVKEFEILFFQEIKPISILISPIKQEPTLNFNYSNLYNYLNSSDSFHPPTIIS